MTLKERYSKEMVPNLMKVLGEKTSWLYLPSNR